jgi:predicted  nucleic acid-binding Zn-ribbon protein
MSISREALKQIHELHQRAKVIRDRVVTGPKMIAARQSAQAKREAELEAARKSLQVEKVMLSQREHQLKGQQSKCDDLRVKLNSVKKNDEYSAIMKALQSEGQSIVQTEEQILEGMGRVETLAAQLVTHEAEVKKAAEESAKFVADVQAQIDGSKAQLAGLEAQIVSAEGAIPEEERDRYRRNVKQRGADALALVDASACTGCFTTVTAQMMNELIAAQGLVFCKSCGRILYLVEEENLTRRR